MAKVCMEITTPNGDHHGWVIHCPACGFAHVFDSRWQFNGDQDKPTFTGSMLVHKSNTNPRCHSFVKDGQIQFLGDCTHSLAGQTVKLEPFKWNEEQ